MANVIIREYVSSDRDKIRQISVSTAMLGRPGRLFFEGDEVLADALTLYYTDYEPESCFVAEVDGQVVGYILSTKDTRSMDSVFLSKIFKPLLLKALCQGVFLHGKNWMLFLRVLGVAMIGGFFMPNFYAEYPAMIHINVMEEHRDLGLGERLMKRCLQYLGNGDLSGVRLATMSDRASEFFQKQGFRLFHTSPRPYFYTVLRKYVTLRIYCRKFE
ncbi:MAG: GNAT family N-acetyltransferase [Candidatus Omnitrophica bacterium]|nr:GNAT family N-acetyltransferase [Candidatus Omnitrophota bacterium]